MKRSKLGEAPFHCWHLAQFIKLMNSIAAEVPELIEQEIPEAKTIKKGEKVERAEEEGKEKDEVVQEMEEDEQDSMHDALLTGQLPI